jgi:hypothetical protein
MLGNRCLDHWGRQPGDAIDCLAGHGFTVANGRLLVEQHTGAWPARSPDLNWLDEFVWGWMVREMHFEDVTTT